MTTTPKLIDWDRDSLAFKGEDLKAKLQRLQADMIDAEWMEDMYRVTALDYEIRMTKHRLETGQTHDMPF